ncbi:hypothetical protein QUF49_04795 [Fictibacillus sp. b24]|uniref:hypothetical protein n=1 Tax=Fictibacillus sp. b24 TaxID=3055863 RepID=UPI0025A2FAF7|nr:hypothetical protein [Fictibacillus sp. b24]MDM5315302.1 hypothetical protein [Fictibacillus sp. b24]
MKAAILKKKEANNKNFASSNKKFEKSTINPEVRSVYPRVLALNPEISAVYPRVYNHRQFPLLPIPSPSSTQKLSDIIM